MIRVRFVGAFWAPGTFLIDLHRRSRRSTGHGWWLRPAALLHMSRNFAERFRFDAAHGHVSVDDNGNAAYDALIATPMSTQSTWLFRMACIRVGPVARCAPERPCCAKSRPF